MANVEPDSDYFVDGHDIGVIQRGERPCLPLQQLHPGPAAECLLGQELERHSAVQLNVVPQEHLTHATPAQLFEHDVPADTLRWPGRRQRMGTEQAVLLRLNLLNLLAWGGIGNAAFVKR